MSRWRRWR
uniref:Uncharacterized protein n=1 Tax=Arundo donax TaxID=35708 RepID=A0A0A9HCW3_ARUDO